MARPQPDSSETIKREISGFFWRANMKGPLLKVSGHDQIGPLKPDSHSGTDTGWRMKEKERKMKEHAKSELYAQVELQQWTNELIVSFS